MRRYGARKGHSGHPKGQPPASPPGDAATDAALLDLVGQDPQTGIEAILNKYESAILGRLHRYAEPYGEHVRTEVKDILFVVVESLLDPSVRAACKARGGQILPWLSKLGEWRVADVARAWEGRVALDTVEAQPLVPEPRDPPAPSPLVRGLYNVFPQLSVRDQLVLRLQFAESRSMKEIGAQLGISAAAAKKAAFDARGRLGRLMEAAGFAPERIRE